VTGSRLPQWVSLGSFTTTITGNSWQQVAHSAAKVAAIMAHNDGREHFGIVFHLGNSNKFWGTAPIEGVQGKFYGGYHQASALGDLRVPGYKTAAGYWSVAGHMDMKAGEWPKHEDGTNDLDKLKAGHMNAVLANPGMKGSAHAGDISYSVYSGGYDH